MAGSDLGPGALDLSVTGLASGSKVRCGSKINGAVAVTNTYRKPVHVKALVVRAIGFEKEEFHADPELEIGPGKTVSIRFELELLPKGSGDARLDVDVSIQEGGPVGSTWTVSVFFHVECPPD